MQETTDLRLQSLPSTKYCVALQEKNAKIASELLDRFVVLYFDEDALVEAVRIYQLLSAKGKMISELDIIIDAIAMANDEVLVTRDTDFSNLDSDKIVILG